MVETGWGENAACPPCPSAMVGRLSGQQREERILFSLDLLLHSHLLNVKISKPF